MYRLPETIMREIILKKCGKFDNHLKVQIETRKRYSALKEDAKLKLIQKSVQEMEEYYRQVSLLLLSLLLLIICLDLDIHD